jgi:hypothetical protein
MLLLFGTSATICAGQGRAGCREQSTKGSSMNNFTPDNPPSCRVCHHFDAGRCLFTRAIVAESFLCLRFAARQDAPTPTPEPMPTAPLPMPAPLPPAPPVESPPEPEAVKPVALIVSDPPRPVWHRQPFNFTAWLKQIFGVNRLGALNMNFPRLNGDGGAVVNTNEQERNTP